MGELQISSFSLSFSLPVRLSLNGLLRAWSPAERRAVELHGLWRCFTCLKFRNSPSEGTQLSLPARVPS